MIETVPDPQAGQAAATDRLCRRFCVAPMMEWTDRHCRYFLRLISRRALLYTEMVTAVAILRGDARRLLRFDPAEHPVALQVGGSDPRELAEAARIGEEFGYREINLNIGCPSDRVQSGRFGACLMAEPGLVAEGVAAMRAAVAVPVTVKCRIGIDDQDPDRDLDRFIDAVAGAGCTTFIVHARKAWLEGLSPKQNRDVPPLDHYRVYRLKRERAGLEIVINGGIENLDSAGAHLAHVDGVMLGRAAYHDPWQLAGVDSRLFGDAPSGLTRRNVLERLVPYAERQLAEGVPLHAITRHILGLCQGQPGARAFRRHLSETAVRPGAGVDVLRRAIDLLEEGSPGRHRAAAE
ncbi:MAG: tRNA dihydrouridine(20/20a) synthase DusA [Hyphomicrobiales bacterium]